MNMLIFAEVLRRGWRSALFWGLGVGLLAFTQVIVVQDNETLQQFTTVYESLPPFLVQALSGGQDIEFLASPEGYLASQFFGIGVLYLAIFAVGAGLNVSANDEEAGILNLYLSLPFSRTRMVIERLAAYVVLALLVILQVFVWLALGASAVPAVGFDLGKIGVGTLNLLPGILLIIAFTLFAGALFRRRSIAIAVAAIFVMGSYFLDFIALGAPNSAIAAIAPLSFFRYVDATDTLRDGINIINWTILLGGTLLLAGGGLALFRRRDIGL